MKLVKPVQSPTSAWHAQKIYFFIKACAQTIVALIVLDAVGKAVNALSAEKILI